MKKNIFVKIIVVLLIVVMLFSIASLTIFAAGKKTGTTKNKTAKSETTDKLIIELQKTVNNLPQKEKIWLKKSEATTIFTGFGSSITAIGALYKAGGSTRNEVCDIVSGVSSVVLGCIPGGAAFIPIVNSIAGLCKEDTPDSTEILMNYISEQTEVLLDEMGEIRSDISDLSDELDNSVSEIISSTYEALEYEDSKNRVRDFLYATSSNDFSYNELKEYLYSPGGYADKVADYGMLSNDDDESNDPENEGESIEYAIGQLYSALTILQGERHAYIDIYENYVYPGTDDYNSVQRDYYVFVNENSDVLDCELPEWKAIEFAKDLYNTYLSAEASRLMCLEYFKQQMIINETTEYTFKDIASGEITLTLAYVNQEIEKYDNPDKYKNIRIQFAKDLLYIINAENSYTLKSSNGFLTTVSNTDADTWGSVYSGQTVYMNKLPDFICEMFDIDPQKFVHKYKIGNADEIEFNGILEIPDTAENITVNLYYDGKKLSEQTITFKVNDYNSFNGGDGSKKDPYLISTIQQLDLMSMKLNDANQQVYYLLINDLDFQNEEFSPIGSFNAESIAFENVFDANGYSIKNITAYCGNRHIGFFAKIEQRGIVKNLTLDNFSVVSAANYLVNDMFVGGIAGESEGTIYNCHVKNSSITPQRHKYLYEDDNYVYNLIGGIVGKSLGNIINCSVMSTNIKPNSVLTYYTNDKKNPHYTYCGGIVGEIYQGAVIDNCMVYNDTFVSTETKTVSDTGAKRYPKIYANSGAIVGYINSDRSANNNGVSTINNVFVESGCIIENNVSVGYIKGKYSGRVYEKDTFINGTHDNANWKWIFEGSDGYLYNRNIITQGSTLNYCGVNAPGVSIKLASDALSVSKNFLAINHHSITSFDYDREVYQSYSYDEDFLHTETIYKTYYCSNILKTAQGDEICNWMYYEKYGCSSENIAPETRFDDLDSNFKCPNCDADKSKFFEKNNGQTIKDILSISATRSDGVKASSCEIIGHYGLNTLDSDKVNAKNHTVQVLFIAYFTSDKTDGVILSVNIPITVKTNMKELIVTTAPTKKYENEAGGETVTHDGGEFEVLWEDGTREEISNNLITIADGYKKTKPSANGNHIQNIIVTYKELTAVYSITVKCNHSFKSETQDATCSEIGFTQDVCSKCKTVKNRVETQKLPHTKEKIPRNEVSATCTLTGYSGDWYCEVCDTCIEKGQVTPIAGHDYDKDNGSKCKRAGCAEYCRHRRYKSIEDAKYVYYVCDICGHIEDQVARTADLKCSRLVVGNAYGLIGSDSEIVVYVKLFKNPGITGVSFRVAYDKKLEYVRCELGDILFDISDTLTQTSGIISFTAGSADAAKDEGSLLKIVFKLPDDATVMDMYKISIGCSSTFTDENADSIAGILTYDGYIQPVTHLPGDVNSDGVVDIFDALLISRYANIRTLEEDNPSEYQKQLNEFKSNKNYTFDEFYADVNLDRDITVLDMVMLLQYFVGKNRKELASNEFVIALNSNDGNLNVNYITEKFYDNGADGVYKNLPTLPDRPGYRFDGWYYTLDVTDLTKNRAKNGELVEYKSEYATQILYAHWTEIYEVKYEANKPNDAIGSIVGSMPTAIFERNTDGISPNRFKLVGWTFEGWNTEPDGRGMRYSDEALIKDISFLEGNVITLYAQWKKEPYSLTLDPNGGTVTPTSATVTYDSTYGSAFDSGELPTPVRTGYNFKGWFIGNTKVTKDNKVKTNSNHTIKAEWEANKHILTLDPNGGTVTPTSATVTYDSTYGSAFDSGEFPIPVRTGYNFRGWFIGNTEVNKDTEVKTNSNHTIKALWEPHSYSYELDTNASTIKTIPSFSKEYVSITYASPGEIVVASAPYYRFAGWYTSSTGGTMVVDAEGKFTNWSVAESCTLYAHWEQYYNEKDYEDYIYVTNDNFKEIREKSNKNFLIIEDITLSDAWEPIPSFSGIIDGANHTISGLKFSINASMEIDRTYGFVNSLSGTIEKLNIDKACYDVDLQNYPRVNADRMVALGTFAGQIEKGGKVLSCNANEPMLMCYAYSDHGPATETSPYEKIKIVLVGGIAGLSMGEIDNCDVTGGIIEGVGAVKYDGQFVEIGCGGIVGYLKSDKVSNCEVTNVIVKSRGCSWYDGDNRAYDARMNSGGLIGIMKCSTSTQTGNTVIGGDRITDADIAHKWSKGYHRKDVYVATDIVDEYLN